MLKIESYIIKSKKEDIYQFIIIFLLFIFDLNCRQMNASINFPLERSIYMKIGNQQCQLKLRQQFQRMNEQYMQRQDNWTLNQYKGNQPLSIYLKELGLDVDDNQQKYGANYQYFQKLDLRHIPKQCVYFQQKNQLWRVQDVQLTVKRQETEEQSLNRYQYNYPIKQSLKQKDVMFCCQKNLIYTYQTIGFAQLSYEQFGQIFKNKCVLINRDINNINQQQNIKKSHQRCSNPIYIDHKSLKQQPYQAFDCYTITNQQVKNWTQNIANSMSILNNNCLIWPCLVLKSINDQENKLQDIIKQKKIYNHIDSNKYGFQNKIFQKIKLKLIKELESQACKQQQQIIKQNQYQLLKQIKQFYEKDNFKNQFTVKLIGTKRIIKIRNNFLPWNIFGQKLINLYQIRHQFLELIPLINIYIGQLNNFKNMERYISRKGNCVGRICQYKQTDMPKKFSISLKYDQLKNNKNVYIKIFNKHQSYNRWIRQEDLKVNMILPAFNRTQLRSFIAQCQVKNICDLIKNIYDNNNRLRIKINQHQQLNIFKNHEQLLEQQRCIQCYYYIKKQQKCCICISCCKIWHIQCKRQHQPKYFHIYKHFYYSYCVQCTSCELCLEKVNNSYTICKKCESIYHKNCAIQQIDQEQQFENVSFLCIKCLICDQCNKRILKNYLTLQDDKLICEQCYQIKKEYILCEICHRIQIDKQNLVLCQNNFCKKYIHKACDKIISGRAFNQYKNLQYKCPQCRIFMKRCIMKWVIEDLKLFDELQYYYEPCYEELPNYKIIVKKPICMLIIRDKISNGDYDENSYEKIKQSFQEMIKNAITFNMPKEDPHYRAKILYIIGSIFLNQVKKIIQNEQVLLLNTNSRQLYDKKVQLFYQQLQKNYFAYLFNYDKQKGVLQINYEDNIVDRQKKFSSQILIQNQLFNGIFKFKLQRQKLIQIKRLMRTPKTIEITYRPIRKAQCFYHPLESLPIIYQCQQCWQTYCCLTKCFKHHLCRRCNQYGCRCDQSSCGCNYINNNNQKQKIKQVGFKLNLTLAQMSQYYRYCFNCIQQNLINKNCYICKQFCFYGYAQCDKCQKIYHLKCNYKKIMKDHFKINIECHYNNQYISMDLMRINICSYCCQDKQEIKKYKQKLYENMKTKTYKINKINDYIQIYKHIYNLAYIKVTNHKLIQLLYINYDAFMKNQYFYRILQQSGSYSLFKKEISIALSNQINNNRQYLSVDQSQNVQQMQIKSEKDNEHLNFIIQKDNNLQYCFIQKCKVRQSINNNNYQQCEYDQSQKQIKNILSNDNGRQNNKEDLQNEKIYQYLKNPLQNIFEKATKDYKGYCRIRNQNYQIKKCQRLDKSILIQNINKIEVQKFYKEYIYQHKLNEYSQRVSTTLISESKVKLITQYLKLFAIRIYQQSKFVQRKGNTCIMNDCPENWRCLKFFQGICYEFLIKRYKNKWFFVINDQQNQVQNINDIINQLRLINENISSQQMLIQFLGLNFQLSIENQDSWNELFKKNLMNSMTKLQRSKLTKQKFEIKNKQNQEVKLNFHQEFMKKQDIFYLKKRVQNKQAQNNLREIKEDRLDIKITLNDIKKDLQLQNGQQKENIQDVLFVQTVNCVYVAPSNIDRLGLFTQRDIKKNTIVIDYIGEVISQAIADFREKRYRFGCYMFGLQSPSYDRLDVIDATFIGNMARYLNHSCNANCKAKTVKSGDNPRIIMYTIRDIKANEELTYDYQFKIQSSEKIQCKCQAYNCQRRLN